jgi:RNA polymerase-associated protein CTR9
LHVHPHDKATLYNIAMIEQKAAEMLFALKETKRTLAELVHALALAAHAQKLFGALATDAAETVPYSRDMADQRRKYGESVLRRGEEHVRAQREYEGRVTARQEEARQRRAEEKERVAEVQVRCALSLGHRRAANMLQRKRAEEDAAAAEQLRKRREEDRKLAAEITAQLKVESDDEREHRPRRPKKPKSEAQSAAVSGDEGDVKPRKRPRKVVRRAEGGEEAVVAGGEDEALFSGGEEAPAKKVRLRLRLRRVLGRRADELGLAAPEEARCAGIGRRGRARRRGGGGGGGRQPVEKAVVSDFEPFRF